ncbi:hypothetical protein ABH926_003224 [Catenulispora sp. GP43]
MRAGVGADTSESGGPEHDAWPVSRRSGDEDTLGGELHDGRQRPSGGRVPASPAGPRTALGPRRTSPRTGFEPRLHLHSGTAGERSRSGARPAIRYVDQVNAEGLAAWAAPRLLWRDPPSRRQHLLGVGVPTLLEVGRARSNPSVPRRSRGISVKAERSMPAAYCMASPAWRSRTSEDTQCKSTFTKLNAVSLSVLPSPNLQVATARASLCIVCAVWASPYSAAAISAVSSTTQYKARSRRTGPRPWVPCARPSPAGHQERPWCGRATTWRARVSE